MALDVQWHNPEQNIIRITFPAQWVWNDLYEMVKQTDALSSTVDHKICYVIDMSQTRIPPVGMSFQRVREAMSNVHPNTDLVAIVGITAMVRVILNAVIRATSKEQSDLVFTETMADAERIIAERQAEWQSKS